MKIFTLIFIVCLILMTGAFLWFVVFLSNPKIKNTPSEEVKIIDTKNLEKLEKLNNFSIPTNTNSAPTGRIDPFAGY